SAGWLSSISSASASSPPWKRLVASFRSIVTASSSARSPYRLVVALRLDVAQLARGQDVPVVVGAVGLGEQHGEPSAPVGHRVDDHDVIAEVPDDPPRAVEGLPDFPGR